MVFFQFILKGLSQTHINLVAFVDPFSLVQWEPDIKSERPNRGVVSETSACAPPQVLTQIRERVAVDVASIEKSNKSDAVGHFPPNLETRQEQRDPPTGAVPTIGPTD